MNSESSDRPRQSPQSPSWNDLGLSSGALELLQKTGFNAPTPIQSKSIPLSLQGHDILASAQTGTGKTASFVLPMVEKLIGKQGTYGLILAPTREIAQQIQGTIELFGNPRGVRSIVLIGGIDMRIDEQALQTYPQILVATPGRLCDHLERGNLWLDFIQMVVLDEADRMLDMGFTDQLSRIFKEIPPSRQTLLFSATFPPSVEHLAQKILNRPRRVAIGRTTASAPNVDQRIIWVNEENKIQELSRIIREEPGSMIVFTRSKEGTTRVWRSLHSRSVYDATYIHSDRLQSHREQALAEFKEGKYRILIATDVAGRGIHVDGIAHVVNYDIPLEPEDYIHRIGRTGRQGATGKATSFVTHQDRKLLQEIEKMLGKRIPEEFQKSDAPQEKPAIAPQKIQVRSNDSAPSRAEPEACGRRRKRDSKASKSGAEKTSINSSGNSSGKPSRKPSVKKSVKKSAKTRETQTN